VATAGPSGSRTPPPPVDQRRDTDLGHSVEATRWQLQQHAWSLGTARLSEHRTRAGKWGESMRGSRTCFQRAAAPARRLPELLWHCGTNAVKRQRLGGHCQTLPSWQPEGAQPAGTAHAGGEGFGCRAVSHCLQESGLGTQIQGSGTLAAAQQQKKVVHTRLIRGAAVTWQMGSKLRAHLQFAERRSPCASSRPCDIGRNALAVAGRSLTRPDGVWGLEGRGGSQKGRYKKRASTRAPYQPLPGRRSRTPRP
jgi:hypothetical protein